MAYASAAMIAANPNAGYTLDSSISSGSSSSSGGGGGSGNTPLTQAQQDALQGIVRDPQGNIIHDARAIINETSRAQDVSNVSGATATPAVSNAVSQSQANVAAANRLLPSIELKLAGKLPLTGGETYASLLRSKQVLESAITAENQTTGVSKSYGSNPQLMAGLVAFGEQKAAQMAQPTPELAKQYASGKVQMGQAQVEVTKSYQSMYGGNDSTLASLVKQAHEADVQHLSSQLGLSTAAIEQNWGMFEGKLGKYSYTNLLKSGQKEAYQKGKAFVGGLGLTLESVTETSVASSPLNLTETTLSDFGFTATNEETTIDLEHPFGLRGSMLSSSGIPSKLYTKTKATIIGSKYSNPFGISQSALNISPQTNKKISLVKTKGGDLFVMEEDIPRIQVAKEPQILNYKGVYYTKEGKTFATIMSEDIFGKMNALQESNKNLTLQLDKAISPKNTGVLGWIEQNQNQIFNVPREMSIDVLTGLGTKSPLELYHAASAGKLSLELQFKELTSGLTKEEHGILERIQAEARGATYEGLTEPAKLYVFNKIVTVGIPALGQATGNTITRIIGAKAANDLVLSPIARASISTGANQYLLGQFGKEVAKTLTTGGIVLSGAAMGIEISSDESGGTSYGFNAPRAVGGVATMGGFVIAASAVTSIGGKAWDLTAGKLGTSDNRLPNPFYKSSLVNLKEGEARQFTGQNSAADIARGKIQAKGEANLLIEAQKEAKADYNFYSGLAATAPSSSKYGFEYKAWVAKAKVESLQAKIAQYVKQPESVSTISSLAKQKTGLFNEYKWGTMTTTTTTKPDAFGRMRSSSLTSFVPSSEEGTRTFQLGRLVLSYETGKVFGFEYPTSINKPFLAWGAAKPSTSSVAVDIPMTTSSGSSSSGLVGGMGSVGKTGSLQLVQTGTKVTSKVVVRIMPKITTMTQTQTKVAPKIATTSRIITKTTPKESILTRTSSTLKVRQEAKYSMNYNLTEKIAAKTNVAEKTGTKENIRESVRQMVTEKVAVRSLIREKIGQKVMVRTLLRQKIPTRTELLPPSARFNMKSKGLGKLTLKGRGKKKNEPYAYSDLLNVAQSQRLFGKGTSPSKARWQTQEAIGRYGYRLQTAEQIKSGGKQAKGFKLGKSNWQGGLSL